MLKLANLSSIYQNRVTRNNCLLDHQNCSISNDSRFNHINKSSHWLLRDTILISAFSKAFYPKLGISKYFDKRYFLTEMVFLSLSIYCLHLSKQKLCRLEKMLEIMKILTTLYKLYLIKCIYYK